MGSNGFEMAATSASRLLVQSPGFRLNYQFINLTRSGCILLIAHGFEVNVLVQHGADVNWRPHKKKEPLLHSRGTQKWCFFFFFSTAGLINDCMVFRLQPAITMVYQYIHSMSLCAKAYSMF